jgi:hypothetical protein
MAVCGFCKKEVTLDDFYEGLKPNKKTLITKKWQKIYMIACPHCQAILSIGFG